MARLITLSIGTALLLVAFTGHSDEGNPFPQVGPDAEQVLLQSLGSTDPARLCGWQHRLTIAQLKSMMYGQERIPQLLAIDACECLEDPWPVMSYLAALMGARQRQVAARASVALLEGLGRFGRADLWDKEVVLSRRRQLVTQLRSLAEDLRLDLDVRVTALIGIGMLLDFDPSLDFPVLDFISDAEAPIRGAAIALITVPAERETLIALAQIAADDPDLVLRGQAAALLCENALSYKVAHLSQDLVVVLRSVLGNGEAPPEGVAPVLACLVRFPEDARGELVELAKSHPDSSVANYWKQLAKY